MTKNNKSQRPLSKHRVRGVKSQRAVNQVIKPQSTISNQKHMQTAGDILNYPYSFDAGTMNEETTMMDNQMAKARWEEQYRVAEIQN